MIRTELNHESVIAIIGASSPSSLNPVQIHAQPSRSAKTWWERKQVFSSSSIHPMTARTKRRRMMGWHQREEMFLDLWRHKKMQLNILLACWWMSTTLFVRNDYSFPRSNDMDCKFRSWIKDFLSGKRNKRFFTQFQLRFWEVYGEKEHLFDECIVCILYPVGWSKNRTYHHDSLHTSDEGKWNRRFLFGGLESWTCHVSWVSVIVQFLHELIFHNTRKLSPCAH